jgi:hypothetical protein
LNDHVRLIARNKTFIDYLAVHSNPFLVRPRAPTETLTHSLFLWGAKAKMAMSWGTSARRPKKSEEDDNRYDLGTMANIRFARPAVSFSLAGALLTSGASLCRQILLGRQRVDVVLADASARHWILLPLDPPGAIRRLLRRARRIIRPATAMSSPIKLKIVTTAKPDRCSCAIYHIHYSTIWSAFTPQPRLRS